MRILRCLLAALLVACAVVRGYPLDDANEDVDGSGEVGPIEPASPTPSSLTDIAEQSNFLKYTVMALIDTLLIVAALLVLFLLSTCPRRE